MSRLTIDITEPQPPLKAMTAREGKAARRPADAQMFEPETVTLPPEIAEELRRRIAASEAGAISEKTFDEIVEEALAEVDE